MPHRNRTLMMVVVLIWIIALAATLVSAAVRSGGDEPGQESSESHDDDVAEPGVQQGNPAGEVSGGSEQSGEDAHVGHEH